MGLDVVFPTLASAQATYRTQLSKERLFVATAAPIDRDADVEIALVIQETGGHVLVLGRALRRVDADTARAHSLGEGAGIVFHVPISEALKGPLRALLTGELRAEPLHIELSQDELAEHLRVFLSEDTAGDHYQTLRIPRSASHEDVRASCLKLLRLFHPDNYYGRVPADLQDDLEAAYQRTTTAYEVLINRTARDAYDIKIGNLASTEGGTSGNVKRERAELEDYKAQNAVGIRKARDLIEAALEDERAGRPKDARNKLKLARNFDPRNPMIARKLRELAG